MQSRLYVRYFNGVLVTISFNLQYTITYFSNSSGSLCNTFAYFLSWTLKLAHHVSLDDDALENNKISWKVSAPGILWNCPFEAAASAKCDRVLQICSAKYLGLHSKMSGPSAPSGHILGGQRASTVKLPWFSLILKSFTFLPKNLSKLVTYINQAFFNTTCTV
jgi:hypothetical protein